MLLVSPSVPHVKVPRVRLGSSHPAMVPAPIPAQCPGEHRCVDPACGGRHLGEWAWAGIALFVAAWDFWVPDPATAAFRRARERNLPLVALAWGTVTLHLFGNLPRDYDPFYRFCDLAGRRKRRAR